MEILEKAQGTGTDVQQLLQFPPTVEVPTAYI